MELDWNLRPGNRSKTFFMFWAEFGQIRHAHHHEVTPSLSSFRRFIGSEATSGCGIVRLDAAANFIRRAALARVARRVAREWVWRQSCPRRLEWSYRDSPELWQQYVSTLPTQPVYALPPLQATASSLRVVGGHFGTSTCCKACQPGEKAHRAQRSMPTPGSGCAAAAAAKP